MAVELKSADEIAIMREAGRIVALAHEAMRAAIRPGVSTWELDQIAAAVFDDHKATPAFLNYPKPNAQPFPATITASINTELVHGIPSKDCVLREGDIVSLDTGCHFQGFVGDAAFSYAVGEVVPSVRNLLEVTEQALYEAIKASVMPNKISDVAKAVQKYASRHGYSVAQEYTGHGVGRKMHEDPTVPNYWPSKSRLRQLRWHDYALQPGMVYAIEPMVIAGKPETVELDDDWTVVIKNGALCAHFEHTIAITDGDPVILTLP